jgi:excisionase family DNA binding protein
VSDLLTVQQLAQKMKTTKWSIYAAVRAGSLPAHRLRPGGRLFFSEAEILEATRRNATPTSTLPTT